jgi:cysteine desulfurase/selenocysteine lyase
MHKHELALKQYINQEFAKIKNLEYINPDAIYPIVLFNIKGVSAQDLAGYLGHKKIIVRAGLACAKLSHYITDVDAAVRASFYIYNDTKDVDRLVKALKNFKPGDELKHVL